MYTEKDKDWAIDLLNRLFDRDFYDAISYHEIKAGGHSYYHIGMYDWIDKNRCFMNDNNIHICNGEDKICIIQKDSNWVIKMSFDCSTNPYYADIKRKNPCVREAEYYSKACNNNLDEFFAATYELGQYRGVPVILQEYAAEDEGLFCEILQTI